MDKCLTPLDTSGTVSLKVCTSFSVQRILRFKTTQLFCKEYFTQNGKSISLQVSTISTARHCVVRKLIHLHPGEANFFLLEEGFLKLSVNFQNSELQETYAQI